MPYDNYVLCIMNYALKKLTTTHRFRRSGTLPNDFAFSFQLSNAFS